MRPYHPDENKLGIGFLVVVLFVLACGVGWVTSWLARPMPLLHSTQGSN